MKTTSHDFVLIIGGGLIGLAIAHKLAREGHRVEVISRRRSEAAGFVAAGMLAPHAEGLNGALLQLGQISLGMIPQWVEDIESDSGMSCGLRPCGIVVPFRSAEERDQYPTAPFGQALNRHALEREAPGLADQWQAGLLFTQDGQIDNRRQLMRALERACVTLGVKFQEGSEVLDLLVEDQRLQGVNIRNAEGELCTIKGHQAILCSGAWSSGLLKELPIFPIKGQMMSLQGPRDVLKRVIFGPGIYLVPREDGLVVVGATSEPDAGFSEGLTPFGQRDLQHGVASLLPKAMKWPPMERWWGFRPSTPDQAPLLGRSSIHGLWLATGHHRNGVLLGAITAKLLAGCLNDKDCITSDAAMLQAFNYKRFLS